MTERQYTTNTEYIYHNNEKAQRKERFGRIKKGIIKAIAVIAAITAFVGIGLRENQNDQPDKVSITTEDIDRGVKPKGETIEIDGLKVGSSHEFVEGVFEIDPNERNVRESNHVINPDTSGGDSNIYNLNGKIMVSDPVIVSKDFEGTWGMAADSDGKRYFFVLDSEGITNVETGEPFSFNTVNTYRAEVRATTTMGSVNQDKSGEKHLAATIVELKE